VHSCSRHQRPPGPVFTRDSSLPVDSERFHRAFTCDNLLHVEPFTPLGD
jgi:hypothetical protein